MSPKRIELLFSALIVLLLGWAIWEARAWPPHSRIFPWSIGLGVLVLALTQLVGSTRRLYRNGAGSDEASASKDSTLPDPSAPRRAAVMCCWILAFFLGIWLLGFRVASLLLTVAFLRFSASESWRISLIAGAICYLFFLLVFHLALQVPLAPGLLADSLGMDSPDEYLIRRLTNLFNY